METFKNWSEVFSASMHKVWIDLTSALPKIFLGILFIFVGWLVARGVKWIVIKFMGLVGLEKALEKIQVPSFLEKMNINTPPIHILARMVYYAVLLIFFVGAAEVFGWKVVSEKIANIIGYIPQLIAGLIILGVGIYLAGLLRNTIRAMGKSFGLASAPMLANIAFFVMIIIISLTSMDQIGINIDFIKSNIYLILGGIGLAFGLGYGLGSKTMVANMLAAFNSKKRFAIGQKLQIGDVSGTIAAIDSTSIALKTEAGTVIYPASKFNEQEILLLN